MAAPQLGLYVVCDGMGGGNAGEIASDLAAEAVRAYLAEAARCADPPLIRPYDAAKSAQANLLASALRAANDVVLRESRSRPDYAGMGTTVVAALLHGNTLAVAHVGDSRLYLVRNGAIHALTTDHSWIAEQILKGTMTEDEAERSPRRNIVTRALGVEYRVDVEMTEAPVMSGDVLLLCSDGLTRGVRPHDILRILDGPDDLQTKADRLVAMANEAGGDDNTTVIVIALRDEIDVGLWERLKKRFVA